MADQITDGRTLVNNADSDSSWVAAGGGGSTAVDTDVKIQGIASLSEQISASVRFIMFNAGTTQDWSNNIFYIWVNSGIVGLLDTQAAGGFRIRFAGPSTSNFFEVYVGGRDNWPNAVAGGWVQFVVDIEEARFEALSGTLGGSGGTPPLTTAIQHVGYASVTGGTMTKAADNTWIDAIYRLPAGLPGIIIEGQNGGSTPWSFSDILTQLGPASGTIKEGPAGSFIVNTPIQFGIDDTTNHQFLDTNQIVFWDKQEFIADGFYNFVATGSTSGFTSVTFGTKTGTGDDAVGSQGIIVATDADAIRWDMDFDNEGLNSGSFYGCTFLHGGLFDFDRDADGGNAIVSCINTQYLDCHAISASFSDQLNCSIVNASSSDGQAFMKTVDMGTIKFCSFQFSDGHAIELITPGTASQTSAGNTFVGYDTDDTTDAVVFINNGVVVTGSVTDLGDTPTVRTGSTAESGSVFVSAVNLVVTVIDESQSPIAGASVFIRSGSDILMNESTNGSGVATEPYNFVSDISVSVRVRKNSPGGTRYLPSETTANVDGNGLTLTQILIVDSIAD